MMKFRNKVLACAAALVIVGPAAAEAATSASIKAQFRNAVSRVLNSVRNDTEYLRNLSNAEFQAFVSCAQGVMSAAPVGRMRYVLAVSNLSEQRRRFDQVASDNGAALKQKITRDCS